MLDQTAAAPTDLQQPRPPAASTLGMRLRVDAAPATFGATPIEVSHEGYKVYRGVAAFGDVVLEYPEFGRNEFVPAGEALAPEALATLVGVPFTIHHPDDLLSAADPDGIKDHVEGTVIRATADMSKDPPELIVDVKVWTRPAQEAIESGEVCDLSPGYQCESDDAPAGAIRSGKTYSLIQRGRRYNHLSGVLTARGVTPDGRRARLDEAASLASYARGVEDETIIEETADAASDEVMSDAPAMDPAEALAAFSPEDAEILKTLTPEGLAILSAMALTAKGEAAEAAVIEGEAAGAEALVEADDAAKADAPLTMDAVKQMIADALAGFKPGADARSDAGTAPPPTAPAAPTPATAARKDAAAVAAERKRIEAEVRAEHDFIAAIRRRGGRCDSLPEATAHAVAVVKATDPALARLADAALKDGRRDHLLDLFTAADDRRRDSILGEQEAALLDVSSADDEYHVARTTGRADSAKPAAATPYLDFSAPVPGPANTAA